MKQVLQAEGGLLSMFLTLGEEFKFCRDAVCSWLWLVFKTNKQKNNILFPQLWWQQFSKCPMVFSFVSWPRFWSCKVGSRVISLPVMVDLSSTLNFKWTLYQVRDSKFRQFLFTCCIYHQNMWMNWEMFSSQVIWVISRTLKTYYFCISVSVWSDLHSDKIVPYNHK